MEKIIGLFLIIIDIIACIFVILNIIRGDLTCSYWLVLIWILNAMVFHIIYYIDRD